MSPRKQSQGNEFQRKDFAERLRASRPAALNGFTIRDLFFGIMRGGILPAKVPPEECSFEIQDLWNRWSHWVNLVHQEISAADVSNTSFSRHHVGRSDAVDSRYLCPATRSSSPHRRIRPHPLYQVRVPHSDARRETPLHRGICTEECRWRPLSVPDGPHSL